MSALKPVVSFTLLICATYFCSLCTAQTSAGKKSYPDTEVGTAAYYSNVFQGRRTASGERYDKNALTAAHNYYPFGTRLRVTNLSNDKSVVLRVNDRGPSTKGRIIDVSRRAARELGFIKSGLTKVQLEVIELGTWR